MNTELIEVDPESKKLALDPSVSNGSERKITIDEVTLLCES
jgi:hypothetical protein